MAEEFLPDHRKLVNSKTHIFSAPISGGRKNFFRHHRFYSTTQRPALGLERRRHRLLEPIPCKDTSLRAMPPLCSLHPAPCSLLAAGCWPGLQGIDRPAAPAAPAVMLAPSPPEPALPPAPQARHSSLLTPHTSLLTPHCSLLTASSGAGTGSRRRTGAAAAAAAQPSASPGAAR